ncbi:GNAT family N-acetyltransferase [Aliikangiella sp. IMCC44359]|uniref:GNAT family N-acetyltransferase n=1 Tax=Aliikangiella sp. IMCC44359 TaxID=3459125 RepID=UPI00403B2F14
MKDIVLETERMFLRAFTLNDVDALFLLATIPEIIRYTGNQPLKSKAEAKMYLQKHPLNDYEVYGYGRFACVFKETNQVIGFSGIKYLDDINENELGYRFLPEYWGKGLATEAAISVIQFAKKQLKLTRLVSVIHPDNQASKNVVMKQGFKYEKSLPFELFNDVEAEIYSQSI